MSTKAPAKKTDMGPTKKVAAKKLSDRELSINYVKEVLKASKIPKEYKAFILKTCKEIEHFNVAQYMRQSRKLSSVSELLNGCINFDQTTEYGFDEDFWYCLSNTIEEFEAGELDADGLEPLMTLGTIKRFDMLDYPICVSSERGLAVGCQSMDAKEFTQFLREAATVFGLKVVKK